MLCFSRICVYILSSFCLEMVLIVSGKGEGFWILLVHPTHFDIEVGDVKA